MKLIQRAIVMLQGLAIVLAVDLLGTGSGVFDAAVYAQNMTPQEIDEYNAHGVDKYNRVAAMYSRTSAGTDSKQRGQAIYYMRCWICHSEIITVGDPFPAPSLRDIFARFDEAYVKARVRSGSAGMPTYDPVNLTDKDLDDLVLYMKETCGKLETGSGCFDENNPPPNPLYKYEQPRD